MEAYFVSCNKNTPNKNSTARRPKQKRSMFVSNCAVCGKKIKVH